MLTKKKFKITLKTSEATVSHSVVTSQPMLAYSGPAAQPASASEPAASAPAPAATPAASGGIEIKSPMVGTFYSSPSPDSPAFVSVGQEITPDTVICIIEAMKVMNEVKAEVAVEARVLGHVPPGLLAHVGAAAEGAAAERDIPLAALRAAYDWWIARKPQTKAEVGHGVRIGWDDASVTQDRGVHIAWLSGALREALTSCGYAPDAIIRSWASRGWLVSHEGRTTARIASAVDQSRPRAHIWSAAAMAAIHDEPVQPSQLF
jgi:acetyl-CoA carboxylase biotin carboxyl carrier protein